MGTIIIRMADLPYALKGFVKEDEDGDYNVYINWKYSLEVQRRTLRHEIGHICHLDFDNDTPVSEAERLVM
jgi:hypothetical protein